MTLGIIESEGYRWKYVRTGACTACDDEWAMLRIPLDAASLRVIVPPELCLRCLLRYTGNGQPPPHERSRR